MLLQMEIVEFFISFIFIPILTKKADKFGQKRSFKLALVFDLSQ